MSAWKLFILGRDKTPLPNCEQCASSGPEHDRDACPHLFCHGFYAATDDPAKLREMRRRSPEGHWAVRTGQASGIVVLDAEGHGVPSGVDVLDDWEAWSGGWPLAPTRRIARTPSGGTHRYYRWEPGIKSRNRVLPGIDIKSDGGYVVIPDMMSMADRYWTAEGDPGILEGEMLNWFRTAKGRRGSADNTVPVGHTDGYDYQRFLREGCPGGMRDEFFNELIFRLRKSGLDLAGIYTETRRHWKLAAQPPNAVWYMPFHHIEYKIRRIWQTVEVDDVGQELRDWANTQRTAVPAQATRRMTSVPRESR